MNLQHAWFGLGVCLILYTLPTMITYPNIESFIGIACGTLLSYTSAKNLGWIN